MSDTLHSTNEKRDKKRCSILSVLLEQETQRQDTVTQVAASPTSESPSTDTSSERRSIFQQSPPTQAPSSLQHSENFPTLQKRPITWHESDNAIGFNSFDERVDSMIQNFFPPNSPPERIEPLKPTSDPCSTGAFKRASVPSSHEGFPLRRRCVSNRELESSLPGYTSSSPYPQMRKVIAQTMHNRFLAMRQSSTTELSAITPKNKISSNEIRNRRRAQHNQAVIDDLCDIVCDLFLAESSLLKPDKRPSFQREVAYDGIKKFLHSLPLRYALTVNTPCEVLVHMRLMAAAKADCTRAAVHIMNLADRPNSCLVTISCRDCSGLLEYITKLLSTGGSRVIDADVMLSTENIVLDRFTVEMKGRLLLDKLQQYVEAYLESMTQKSEEEEPSLSPLVPSPTAQTLTREPRHHGSLYFNLHPDRTSTQQLSLEKEMEDSVPLVDFLAPVLPSRGDTSSQKQTSGESASDSRQNPRELVNRSAEYDFSYNVPQIAFEGIHLLRILGKGRISSIYRAAWIQRRRKPEVVALKVATQDLSDLQELRHEAEVASMLNHENVCRLLGVASHPECFCLAYEYCENGSLFSLLTDTTRCYEYLPIALDIANGMAYLHSRNVIHRDLKPSNILLSSRNRAKISDFGISVTNTGQELTAETGTYRWMAPEVIRHESYSSNADVYSFGVVMWQLITREVPFATSTPIQTAYAVAEGQRPDIPTSTPEPIRRIVVSCWDDDSHTRPSFTYITMALADYVKMAFRPDNVGAATVQIANEMLANVYGNSTVNVDFSAPVSLPRTANRSRGKEKGNIAPSSWVYGAPGSSFGSNCSIGLEL